MSTLFFHSRLFQTRRGAWALAAGFAFLILAAAPFALGISRWLRGQNLLLVLVIALFIVFFGYLLAYLFYRIKGAPLRVWFFLAGLFLFGGILLALNRTPEERVHLLEFTLLGLLLLKACRLSFQGNTPYLLALLLAMGTGWCDELWQALLPGRVYDIQDVLNNAGGGVLGVALARIRYNYGKPADNE
ncbi:MAG: VanZ family protein [Deltaproteobacteria bacterium]|nr:VanZ family protein [Deltaproteobacteria bacterium]MBI4223449.1 VanZ family protein [Deltaproteobacteria bacterium]